MGNRIVLYLIPLVLPCSTSKCNIPFLRDYVQDNGKNGCEFAVRDCRMLPTSGLSGMDYDGLTGKELEVFQFISVFIVSFFLPLIFIATIADLIHRYSSRKRSENVDFWSGLMTWSVYDNFKSLLKSKGGTFPFLNGMRVLCAYWILLGHTFSLPVALDMEPGKTINLIKELRKSIAWTPIENFTLSVDTFFFISGFLLFHSSWVALNKNNGKMNIPLFLLRKYWRLTKGTIVLMISTTIFYLPRSDVCFSVVMEFLKCGCTSPLWRNFLFIQNYWSYSEMCGPHTWFLALLFQYHILGVLIIFLIYRNRDIGIITGMIIVIACNVITYIILNHNIQEFEEAEKNERFYLMKREICITTVYRLPFDHFGPYWLGIVTGWLLKSHHYCILKKKYHLVAWIMSVICLASAVFSCHLQNTASYIFIYESLHRTVWGIGLIWIVYTCANGNGGILNKFLSWRPFIVLGDLTFFFYLVHPYIVLKDCCQHSGNYPFQVPYWLCRSVVSTVISFGIAFFFHVALERPVLQWKPHA